MKMPSPIRAIIHPKGNLEAFRELILLLTQHKDLTLELAKREIQDRYVGQIFGLFWTFAHPLILILVYGFMFGFIFKVKVAGSLTLPTDYFAYILAGLIPWLTFAESMTKSSMVITGNVNVVKQMIFPVEVLPVKGELASLFTEIIFLGLFLFYQIFFQGFIPATYLLIPVALFLQFMAMTGVSYILAAVTPFFRDTREFVQIFTTIGIYIAPLFYLPDSLPPVIRPVIYLNPFSYLIWCYQDIISFGRIEHAWSWVVFTLLSLFIFTFGYRVFRNLKVMFGNVL